MINEGEQPNCKGLDAQQIRINVPRVAVICPLDPMANVPASLLLVFSPSRVGR
jgi:hypothetical protein